MNNRTLKCPQCNEYLVESMIQGGIYECLQCGHIEEDNEDHRLYENFNNNEEDFIEYYYKENNITKYDGLLNPRKK